MENIVCKFGAPLSLLSDQGREVNGLIAHEICRLLDVEKLHTTVYKASTNSQVERFHKTLNAMIGRVISEKQTDWDELLPYVMAAYRASPHNSTHYSPNMLIFGRENRMPLDLVLGLPEPENPARDYDDFVSDVQEKMRAAYNIVRDELKQAANRNKRYYDMSVRPTKFQAGDWVYYYNPRRYTGKSEKWSRKYIGPMLVLKQLGPVNYLLQKTKNSLPFVSHVDKMKRCYSRTPVVQKQNDVMQSSVLQDVATAMHDNTAVVSDDLLPFQPPSTDDLLELAASNDSVNANEQSEQVMRPRRVIRLPARYRC
jgi:hypothetical protein